MKAVRCKDHRAGLTHVAAPTGERSGQGGAAEAFDIAGNRAAGAIKVTLNP